MIIVENKRPMCGIVLPNNPTPRERFAADELISYIKKILKWFKNILTIFLYSFSIIDNVGWGLAPATILTQINGGDKPPPYIIK